MSEQDVNIRVTGHLNGEDFPLLMREIEEIAVKYHLVYIDEVMNKENDDDWA